MYVVYQKLRATSARVECSSDWSRLWTAVAHAHHVSKSPSPVVAGRDQLLDWSLADHFTRFGMGALHAHDSLHARSGSVDCRSTTRVHDRVFGTRRDDGRSLGLAGNRELDGRPIGSALGTIREDLSRQWGKHRDLPTQDQQMILNVYERLVAVDQPLGDTIGEFDLDGDGQISTWELDHALEHWKIPPEESHVLKGVMEARVGRAAMPTEQWLDTLQQLYLDAQAAAASDTAWQGSLKTKKTFVELFNELDQDHDGYISNDEFRAFLDTHAIRLSPHDEELLLFGTDSQGGPTRMNLFEFMKRMRKVVRVGIQEIGYGYLPLAWASLTAYWLGLGLSELGLTLHRLPATVFGAAANTPE